MNAPQPGILEPPPGHARYLEFIAVPDRAGADTMSLLAGLAIDDGAVVGLGPGLVAGLGGRIEGLRAFPALSGPGCAVPSTQADLWCWLRGADRGEITHRGRAFARAVAAGFRPGRTVDGFTYGEGRDLSGYIDGTENPTGDAAVDAAILKGAGPALDGSSFVAVQQWAHDLDRIEAMAERERDHVIGRRLSDNEEIDEAPPSAHIKRTAQESFAPEAFVLRRSMPWSDRDGAGLMFVAFGKSFDAFEALLRRMTGQEDGILDNLFRFTRPVSGSYFWCPPVAGGALQLAAIGR